MNKALAIAVLLIAAQVNVTALVPAAPGQAPPPWWVGGGLLWPFFAGTKTLLPAGGLRDTLTPILGITAGVLFVMAALAVWGRFVPVAWLPVLVIGGVAASVVLQVIWLSGWAVLPLVVDAVLVWAVVGAQGVVGRVGG